MAVSYPLPTLGPTVTTAGITAPVYSDIYLSLVASYQAIYGSDVVLTADTQDGQWIGIIAQAIADSNNGAIQAYNAFSPITAQGTNLSNVVAINGLVREAGSNSTCNVTITGTAGTIITNGVVADSLGNSWNLPASVTIPSTSSITVTATCATLGAINAAIGTITIISTPTRGWLTVTNPVAASPGSNVETDPQLRARQALSTAISSVSPMDSVVAAVMNVSGVTRVNYDENTTSLPDANGVPDHSFALVVEGGSATTIAQTIYNTKTPGTGTYGSISEVLIDPYGVPTTISFSPPTYERIVVNVSLHALPGYTVNIGNNVQTAIQNYINGLPIGGDIYWTQLIAAAIEGSGGLGTFNLTALTMAIYGNTPSTADIMIAYNQAASSLASDITLSLV